MQNLPTPNIVRSVKRTMSMHISPKGDLIIKAPFFVPERLIENFIKAKQEWIFKALQKVESRKVSQKTYLEGEEFLYLGDAYKLHIGNFKEITAADGFLNFPDFMVFRIKKELANWYIRESKKVITQRVVQVSVKMGTKFKSIRFSDTSSKWGTCFHDNSLQFNWRLVMTPLTVINYVVVHELAHTKEKNHGPRFWAKVSLYTPAFKQHRKWLEKNKHLLNF